MKKLLLLLLLPVTLSLNGCIFIYGYAPPVQQGNAITQKQLQRLRTGMSQAQVVAIMGTPILTNTFRNNEYDYVYTYQVFSHRLKERKVVIHFRNGRVASMHKDVKNYMPPKALPHVSTHTTRHS